MNQLMLAQASTLAAYTDLFYDIGAPIDCELERLNLPINPALSFDAKIPVIQSLNFIQAVNDKEQIDDIVFRAFERRLDGRSGQNTLPKAYGLPSLYSGLCQFLEIAREDNPCFHISMAHRRNQLCIEAQFPTDFTNEDLHITEWTIILQLLSIIRGSLGADFCPEEIMFQRPFTPCRDALEDMPNARILFAQPKTSIAMPLEVLSCSVEMESSLRALRKDETLSGQCFETGAYSLSNSLKHMMRAYLDGGVPSIDTSAEIVGVSKRTLQRLLAQEGQSYDALRQQSQFEVASELLRQPELRIIDVACAVGYEDPSHFSRAFRRIAGVTPREYRRHTGVQA